MVRFVKCTGRFARVAALGLLVVALVWMAGAAPAQAESGTVIIRALQSGDAYVSPGAVQSHHASPGDTAQLNAVARNARSKGVNEKFLIVRTYPSRYPNAAAAASSVRDTLGFDGTLILVSTRGMGISSNKLSASERRAILRKAEATCIAQSFTACSVIAGNETVSRIQADQSSSNRNAAIFWLVALVILAAIIGFLVWGVVRRRRAVTGRLADLQRAASNTLSLADDAVQQIEAESAGAGKPLATDVRAEYDRALALRDQARTELERAASAEMLTQANQDAAQAVLALQGVMRRVGINSPLANPLEAPGRRCFYCGRDDRPPYTQETISDGRGNSMEAWVCAVDARQLQEGRKPQVATVQYGGAAVPWWAVPGNPWYYGYGGPTWQYWLPFIVGMDVGTWFGGGWGYAPAYAGYGGDWDDSGFAGGDVSGVAAQPSDASGVDFGGWVDSGGSGGWDSSGGGWDSGGGGDWGGGDSGGGDGGGWG